MNKRQSTSQGTNNEKEERENAENHDPNTKFIQKRKVDEVELVPEKPKSDLKRITEAKWTLINNVNIPNNDDCTNCMQGKIEWGGRCLSCKRRCCVKCLTDTENKLCEECHYKHWKELMIYIFPDCCKLCLKEMDYLGDACPKCEGCNICFDCIKESQNCIRCIKHNNFFTLLKK